MRIVGALLAAMVVCAGIADPVRAQLDEPACVETPRPDPGLPPLVFERAAFGFHDEELVLCSPGFEHPARIAARLWVPQECVGAPCPGVLISHGFAFTKEFTFADMLNAARRGMVVLSYDVRGHGGSGGQVGLMGREEIADQAEVLRWFHEQVDVTRVGVYGISQGGSHAVMAAMFNCGSDRAASFDSSISCDSGRRWVDAVVPIQAPTALGSDGTCSTFAIEAVPESRFNFGLAREAVRCPFVGTPLQEIVEAATDSLPPIDFSVNDYLRDDRVGRIDVPAYLVTSFFDRLVVPQNVTRLYEKLRARVDDPHDPYKKDLRLLISNDGHGAIGGNFAVLDDVFAWLERQLKADPQPLRAAPVTIAQEWENNAFRLESEWPIPGTVEGALCLSRTTSDEEANGSLGDCPTTGDQQVDRLVNLPVVSSPPGVPFTGFLNQVTASTGARGIPGVRLVFQGEPQATTVEITGLPVVGLWVSSSDPEGKGLGQIHASLAELGADGQVTEFARRRVGLHDLGPDPRFVELDLTVSSHRLDPGSRLMLTITPTDPGEALPFLTTDTTTIHHDSTHVSTLSIATVPVDRLVPAGDPPSGAAFPDNAIGAICSAFGQDCGQ